MSWQYFYLFKPLICRLINILKMNIATNRNRREVRIMACTKLLVERSTRGNVLALQFTGLLNMIFQQTASQACFTRNFAFVVNLGDPEDLPLKVCWTLPSKLESKMNSIP